MTTRSQYLKAALAACAALCGGCNMLPDVCYEEPTAAFAPHPADEEPVFDEPAWTYRRPLGSGIATHVVLPFGYDEQPFYPIEQGDEAVFRVRFLLGQTAPTATDVRVACFVEGRAVAIGVGDPLASSSTVVLHEGVGVADITLTPDQLQPGLNQVDVVALYRRESGYLELGRTDAFTIANGSLTPQHYEDTPLAPSDAPRNTPDAMLSDPVTGERVTNVWSRRGDVDVTLNLIPGAGDAYCGGFDRFALVALRDGIPTPIDGHDRIVTTLREGEQRQLRYRLPLWDDEARHWYIVLALSGLGRVTRNQVGNPSFAARNGPVLLAVGWNGAL